MKNNIILDSSAVIALINREPGYQQVEDHLPNVTISAVNLSETIDVLSRTNIINAEIEILIKNVISEVHPFDQEQAIIAAYLRKNTHSYGLSLGDRACLALAKTLNLPVLTADKAWGKLKEDIDIRIIR